ncbi:MAG TPA: hypothetical protein VN654_03950 [Vicinamibacterales bacterium]|nr:hypothetical protein [Vicinamibacterales bacterium]
MTLVDSILLDLTEWLCRRLQVLTGRTNVWLAFQLTNFSIVVFFVWAGMHFRIGARPFRIALAAFCGGLLYLLTQTLFKVPVETYENNEYRRVSRGLRNPRRMRDAPLRIAFLTFSLLLFFPVLFVVRYPQVLATLNLGVSSFIVAHGLTLLTTVMLYLLACDPLPPCHGKVREWWRSLVPARRVPAAVAED